MKKSATITLALLGVSGLLTSCGEPDIEAQAYKDVASCTAAGNPYDACSKAFEDSKKEYERSAPTYTSLKDCEEEFGVGGCTPKQPVQQAGVPNQTIIQQGAQQSHDSFFAPMMMGYLMGSNFGSNVNHYNVSPQPLYRYPKTNSYVTGSGNSVTSSFGKFKATQTAVSRPSVSSTSRTVTMSRGGFGSRVSVAS